MTIATWDVRIDLRASARTQLGCVVDAVEHLQPKVHASRFGAVEVAVRAESGRAARDYVEVVLERQPGAGRAVGVITVGAPPEPDQN